MNILKRTVLPVHRLCHVQKRKQHHCSGSLAQRQISINACLQAQFFHGHAAGRFFSHMGRKQKVRHQRTEFLGQKGRHQGNQAIQYHRNPVNGTAQHQPAHARNIKTADRFQHRQRILRIRMMQCNGLFDHLYFLFQSRVGKPGSPPGHKLHRGLQKDAGHRAAGGGVANSHLSDCQQIISTIL